MNAKIPYFNLCRQERLCLSEARLEFLFEKIKNKGPKIHYFALKLYTGPPNCTVGSPNLRVGGGLPGHPSGSASVHLF